jgi:hypothetical protein
VVEESMSPWNSLIRRNISQKGGIRIIDPSAVSPKLSELKSITFRKEAIVELPSGKGYQVLWRCVSVSTLMVQINILRSLNYSVVVEYLRQDSPKEVLWSHSCCEWFGMRGVMAQWSYVTSN